MSRPVFIIGIKVLFFFNFTCTIKDLRLRKYVFNDKKFRNRRYQRLESSPSYKWTCTFQAPKSPKTRKVCDRWPNVSLNNSVTESWRWEVEGPTKIFTEWRDTGRVFLVYKFTLFIVVLLKGINHGNTRLACSSNLLGSLI